MKDFIKTENLVAVGLVVALLVSLFTGPYELSISIAGGLIGYIGRGHIDTQNTKDTKGVGNERA